MVVLTGSFDHHMVIIAGSFDHAKVILTGSFDHELSMRRVSLLKQCH